MTLSRRLTISTGLLIAVLVAVAAAGLWGVGALNRDLTAAQAEYERMRWCYEAGMHAWRAREALAGDRPRVGEAVGEVIAAWSDLKEEAPDDPDFARWAEALRRAAGVLSDSGLDAPSALAAAWEDLTGVISGAAARAAEARQAIRDIQARADRQRRVVTVALAAFAAAAGVLAVVVGVLQYRAVMRPIREAVGGVRDVARGHFGYRLRESGDAELAELARDFNSMAEDLEVLYANLESQVRAKSAALARSERLASVGHLAAGVAHEINNPLGIIAAHAELALRDASVSDQRRAVLETIRDEAFRCKGITDRLLSLSRGSVHRAAVDVLALAEDVAEQVRLLPTAGGATRLEVSGEPVTVQTDADLVRQVVLNLMVNALEAARGSAGRGEGDGGRVSVEVSRQAEGVAIAVADDGCGMDVDGLGRVFEPFFTTKRGGEKPGTGLGLSISHAIAEQLGGGLEAASEGPGKGSVFTLRLPAKHAAAGGGG